MNLGLDEIMWFTSTKGSPYKVPSASLSIVLIELQFFQLLHANYLVPSELEIHILNNLLYLFARKNNYAAEQQNS